MRKAIFFSIMMAILLACVELGSFALISLVNHGIAQMDVVGVLLDDAVDFTDQEVNDYFDTRHPILGWPSTKALASDGYNQLGARPDPFHPETEPPCVAAFGDSFTYSSYVDDSNAWPHQLSAKLGCYVANYGVGGYGTDQAYLRFTLTDVEPAPVIVLGLFPENIQRNVNQYRGYLEARHELVFKPRFVLSDNKLSQEPIVGRDGFDFDRLKATPEQYFRHDFFIPDTTYGPITIRFPYTLTVLRALTHPRTISFLSKEPTWIDLYDPNHKANGFQITAAILREFVLKAHDMEKNPIIYVFTTASSVKIFQETGSWPYQSILDFLKTTGLPYVHVGDHLSKYIELEDVCRIFDTQHMLGCTGHFTDEGYRIVAETLYDFIIQNNLLRSDRAATGAQLQ